MHRVATDWIASAQTRLAMTSGSYPALPLPMVLMDSGLAGCAALRNDDDEKSTLDTFSTRQLICPSRQLVARGYSDFHNST
jgi:hypothetical protein